MGLIPCVGCELEEFKPKGGGRYLCPKHEASNERIIELEAQLRERDTWIKQLHAFTGRGDHGPEENVGCLVDHIISIRETADAETARADEAEVALARLRDAMEECVVDWREQASAEEHSQRGAGNEAMMACNERGAKTYRYCADDLEACLKEPK
jgi:hypothetical protein